MYDFKIGALLDSFKMSIKDAIGKAAKMGISGLQMYATSGEYSPENMTTDKIHELMDMMNSNGMVFSAICGDLGMGFGNPEKNPELIEKSKRIMDLAAELGTNIVTTHIGVIPSDSNHPRYKIMQEACHKLCRFVKCAFCNRNRSGDLKDIERILGYAGFKGSGGKS